MRAWCFSDLHLGPDDPFPLPVPDADVARVAGDLRPGLVDSLALLADTVRPRMRVVFVPDNHEFPGGIMDRELDAGRVAQKLGIDLLDGGATVVDGVTIAGATLWTDYAVAGPGRRAAVIAAAMTGISDHRLIRIVPGDPRRFLPADALDRHDAGLRFLEGEALREAGGARRDHASRSDAGIRSTPGSRAIRSTRRSCRTRPGQSSAWRRGDGPTATSTLRASTGWRDACRP